MPAISPSTGVFAQGDQGVREAGKHHTTIISSSSLGTRQFKLYDTSQDGFLDFMELKYMMEKVAPSLSRRFCNLTCAFAGRRTPGPGST